MSQKFRYIRIHDPILVRELNGSAVLSNGKPIVINFVHFIAARLHDPGFGRSFETLEAAATIREAVAALDARSEYLALPEFAWRLLASTVRLPSESATYDPIVGMNVLPMMRAVLSATTEAPETRSSAGAVMDTMLEHTDGDQQPAN